MGGNLGLYNSEEAKDIAARAHMNTFLGATECENPADYLQKEYGLTPDQVRNKESDETQFFPDELGEIVSYTIAHYGDSAKE